MNKEDYLSDADMDAMHDALDSTFSNGTDGVKVCVWADGTWCLKEEVMVMYHMSDDYAIIVVSDEDEAGIDAAVTEYLKGPK